MSRGLWLPLLVALVLRLVPVLAADRVVADVERYERVATHLLDASPNPYETRRLFPYPPPWAAVEAGALWLARHGIGSFAVNVKIPVLLADLLVVAALGVAARAGRAAAAAAWLYAAHPVSLLVTGFHGQFDAIALAFVLLALDSLARERRDTSAFLLGAAIATKSFPVLFLPFLALGKGASPRSALRFAVIALLPVAALLLPFVLADAGAVRRELFAYTGIADFGWTGVVRGLEWLTSGVLPRSEARFWPVASLASKVLVLSAWAALVVAFARRRPDLTPHRACLVTMVGFCVLYGALSAQYLLWPVVLGAARPTRSFALYTAAATAGLVGFYLFLAPGVLVAAPLTADAAARAGRLWVLGASLTLAASAAWLLGLLRAETAPTPA